MTDHRHTLRTFLETDRHRLTAALDGRAWSPEAAERLTHHLRFAVQVQAVYLEGSDPRDPALRERVAAISPRTLAEALAWLDTCTEGLVAAIQRVDDARLHAPVLDPHERGLTVLGHLYDFCRANAMLVEWAHTLAHGSDHPAGTLRDLIGEEA